MTEAIWEGVYSSFSEAPLEGPGFDGDEWSERSLRRLEPFMNRGKQVWAESPELMRRAGWLPLLAALVQERKGDVVVLDFGGGLGVGYLAVRSAVPASNLRFHVVEKTSICRLGMRLFDQDAGIRFYDSLPRLLERADIVHLGSSLHYIEHWRELLRRLASYSPAYLLLTDLPAGDIPTFVTVQRYYGSRIPCWFFNLEEVVQAMKEVGAELLCRSLYFSMIRGIETRLPMENFPERLRLAHTVNLLFGFEGRCGGRP